MTRPADITISEVERDVREPEVLRALIENHARFLAFVERRVGNRDVAEDILQEAFVRGTARADSLRDSESLVAWFYRILRNAIVDHARRQSARDRALEQMVAEGETESIEQDAELEAVVCGCVLSLLETLKPEYGAAIRRVDLEGASVRGYGEEVGISATNAGVRLHRAREALRKQLARSCGTCLTHGCFDCRCVGAGG